MPGAQPYRPPVARAASSARRGANVPAGVPGVYRVPRRRTVVTQSDTGAATVAPAPWIQPEDTWISLQRIVYVSQQPNIGDTDEERIANHPTVCASVEAGPGSQGLITDFPGALVGGPDVTCAQLYFPAAALTCPQVTPDFPDDYPPGAIDVEYESASGTLVSLEFPGSSLLSFSVIDLGTAGSLGGKVLRVDLDVFSPDPWTSPTDHLRWLTPAELAAADVVASVAQGASATTVTETITDLQADDGYGVFVVAVDVNIAGQPWGHGDKGEVRLGGFGPRYNYTPPRYRFTF